MSGTDKPAESKPKSGKFRYEDGPTTHIGSHAGDECAKGEVITLTLAEAEWFNDRGYTLKKA